MCTTNMKVTVNVEVNLRSLDTGLPGYLAGIIV